MPTSIKEIKRAGFDGIECHLIGGLRSSKRVAQVRQEAGDLGLDVRFHLGWSWETGQRNLYNIVARPLGVLVPVGMSLSEQVRDVGTDSVVVYGNQYNEPVRDNYVYQTASLFVDGKMYAGFYTNFLNAAQANRLPVVFDTQHVLEWLQDQWSVAGLSSDWSTLGKMLYEQWNNLCPLVKEIHVCDFDPRLGPTRGRNLFPGDGVLPLDQFFASVRSSGWDGILTPEVAPQHLRGKDRLRMLRDKMDRFLA